MQLKAILASAILCGTFTVSAAEIKLSGPGMTLTFDHTGNRLSLLQMQRDSAAPLLYIDPAGAKPGPGPVGNPLTVVIREGRFKGTYGIQTFKTTGVKNTERKLLAYLEHDTMPLLMAVQVEVEGAVAAWNAQAFWNGEEAVELDIYFPLLSRVRFADPMKDRILVAKTSGMTLGPLGEINHSGAYVGSLSAPVFIAEGGNRGLAVVDNNMADYADDPGASALRGQVAGNTFPVSEMTYRSSKVKGGPDGVFLGIRYTRRFRGINEAGGVQQYESAEKGGGPLPIRKLGDAVDIGPIRTYAYEGSWKVGGLWLREQRSHLKFRTSPAKWYQDTTFIAEDMGDSMVNKGWSFYDYPKVLADKQRLGADLFHIPGFHDPEILGTSRNWQNRGDYFHAAQNLGGFDAVREGIRTVHRQNGHILYYIEGLIMWKRSRIGRASGKEWALMEPDGTYTEHYRGFWHMCPAVKEWQDWFAKTAAEIVRTTGVDGFFIDSTLATYNHRCFNPAHKHPHPDVWTWGVRQVLKRMREEVDKVNPETIIITEGEADLGREHGDGFVSHGHFWNQGLFTEPLLRFMHPDMRAYESWGYTKEPRKEHIWNSVNGYRIYAHNPARDLMAPLSLRTRRYYDAFPEICDAPMSVLDVGCDNCIAQIYEGTKYVITVGNTTADVVEATMKIPVNGSVLFDRVDSKRVSIVNGRATLKMEPFELRAFEVRR